MATIITYEYDEETLAVLLSNLREARVILGGIPPTGSDEMDNNIQNICVKIDELADSLT